MPSEDHATDAGRRYPIDLVAFSGADGLSLVSLSNGSGEQSGKLWDARTGVELPIPNGDAIAVSHDHLRVASVRNDERVLVRDLRSGTIRQTIPQGAAGIRWIAFSPDGTCLAIVGRDWTMKVWDLERGAESFARRYEHGIETFAFSPDGLSLAVASEKAIHVCDARTGVESRVFLGHKDTVTSVAFSKDGQLASGSIDQSVRLWNLSAGRESHTLRGHKRSVSCVVFSPDGARLVSGSADQTVRVWDAKDGTELLVLHEPSGITSVAFSPDGARLAAGRRDRTIRVWETRVTSDTAILHGHTDMVHSIAFSPDGAQLASGSADQSVKLWDAQTGKELMSLREHAGDVLSVACSSDGSRLASAGHDRVLRIWDTGTGMCLRSIGAFSNDPVTAVAFGAAGDLVAGGSAAGDIKVWKTGSGPEILALHGHTRELASIAFSRDGRRLMSKDREGVMKAWDVPSGRECKVVLADLPPDPQRHPTRPLIAVASGSTIRLIDLSPSSEEERLFRTGMSRFDADWHRDQVRSDVKTDGQFAAVYHRCQLVLRDPLDFAEWKRLFADTADPDRDRLRSETIDRILLVDPGLAPIYEQRARMRAAQFRFADACADEIASLALSAGNRFGWPRWAEGWRSKGDRFADRQERELAIGAFRQAARFDRTNVEHMHRLIWAQSAATNGDGFRAACRQLRDFETMDDVAPVFRVSATLCQGLTAFPSLLTIDNSAPADEILTSLQRSRNDVLVYTACLRPDHGFDAGHLVDLARQNAELEPSLEHREHYGAALYRAGRFAEAASILADVRKEMEEVRRVKADVWTKLFLAMAYLRLDRTADVEPLIRSARLSDDSWEARLIYESLHAEVARLRTRR